MPLPPSLLDTTALTPTCQPTLGRQLQLGIAAAAVQPAHQLAIQVYLARAEWGRARFERAPRLETPSRNCFSGGCAASLNRHPC